jgi:UDP-glucose 4-epimerase
MDLGKLKSVISEQSILAQASIGEKQLISPRAFPLTKKTNILVTGGAGFIGSHLVDRLVGMGFGVRVLDNLSSGKISNIEGHVKSGAIDFVEGSIHDSALVKKCIHGIYGIVHLAAVVSVPFSMKNPQLTFETNAGDTLNLLSSAAQNGVEKFVFVSSCAVYGESTHLPIDELHPINPISPYAQSKLIAERSCIGFFDRKLLKTVVFRLFNVYGPRQGLSEYSGVITKFIDKAKQGSPLIIYGDGSQTRDFVSVFDVVDAVVSALKRDSAEGKVINVGSGVATSINELAKTVLDLTGSKCKIRYLAPREGDIKNSYANISKARKLLGFEPSVSLKDGLKGLLQEKAAE